MRTIAPVMIVVALGVAGMMLSMSGFAGAWGADPPQTQAAQKALNDSADRANPNKGPVEGPVASGDSSIVGLIVSGLGAIAKFAGAVAVLPVTLLHLGFPLWFAIPVGSIVYLVAGIGVIEFATNREWT